MANPFVPVELNQDEDEFIKCHPSCSGSTATPTLFENTQDNKAFCTQFFEDQLNQEDDEFDEINQQLNQVLLDDQFKPSLIQAFQADMSSYLSHEKLTKNSRRMQQEYQNANPKEKEHVFNTFIKNDIENLSLDKYKHYILEKIIEVGPPAHRNLILDRIYNSIYKLVRDLYACKVMQKGLEILTQFPQDSPKQLENFINFIHQDNQQMKKIYVDKIANQIIQKSLEVFEGENLYLLLEILSKYILNKNQEKFELSTDQFGCLIVNKIIDIFPKQFEPKIKNIVNNIIVKTVENSSGLTRRQYANYIIQQILEKGQEQHKRLLMDTYLIKDFAAMAMDKYGSNVAEKAIIYAGPQWRLMLWEQEVSRSESSLKKLVNDQFANYPIQRLYEYLEIEQRNEFISILNKLNSQSLLNHHGQIVMKFALTNYHVKRFAQKIAQSEFKKTTKIQEKNKQIKSQQSQKQIQQLQQQQILQQQQQMQPLDYQLYQNAMMQQMLMFQQQQQQQQILQQQQQQKLPQQFDQNVMNYSLLEQQQKMMFLWLQQQQMNNMNMSYYNGQMK